MELRVADYARPETLVSTFAGVERLRLISGSEFGQRKAQHGAVIAFLGRRVRGPDLCTLDSLAEPARNEVQGYDDATLLDSP